MKTILIPVDGSEYSTRAIEKGKELVKAFDSNVILINVIHPTYPIYSFGHNVAPILNIDQLNQDIRKISEEILDAAIKLFGPKTDKIKGFTLEGDPANAIIDYANSNEIDLVIMGSHGLGAVVNRMLMGSVTNKVLHHVKTPVMVVK
ncbi:MAG: universal stress protein [Eubacteriales bacterium]